MTPRLSGAYPRACQGLDVFTVAPCALLHQKSTRPRVRRVAAGAELSPLTHALPGHPCAWSDPTRLIAYVSNGLGRDRLAVSHPRHKETVMPRPYKGDRVALTTKVPRSYFEKLDRLSHITGETKVDYIAALIVKDLDAIDINELEGQEQLPMSA